MTQAQTMFAKIWQRHLIYEDADGRSLLHVSRHFAHDGSSHAFSFLQNRKLSVRHPDQLFTTPDHGVSTHSHNIEDIHDPDQLRVVKGLSENSKKYGFTMFGLSDSRQGIIHVVGPEQGLTQPGLLIVCGDSHTSTHGALGALSFGIGASEVCHVLATQSIWQRKPKTMRVHIEGALSDYVTAKDVILALIRKIGANGAAGHVIEYTGSTIKNMSMEARLTLCNMSIEAGARAGLIAPDEITYAYLKGKPYAPAGADWNLAEGYWRSLPSDEGARFDTEIHFNADELAPMVTWGNSPEECLPVSENIPHAKNYPSQQQDAVLKTLEYMGLNSGDLLENVAIDLVFIGSCTNGRLEDLRAAAEIAKRGRAVVPAIVVPGSSLVKSQAEQEGLDQIFLQAGFQWRESGCSMCVGMNGDLVPSGQRCASTTNRNFRGRQGLGSRTHLMSPSMAAAAALTGRITDVRKLSSGEVK